MQKAFVPTIGKRFNVVPLTGGDETDAAGNLKPSKKKSTDRIDGIVAGIMAMGRAMVDQRGVPQVFLIWDAKYLDGLQRIAA